MGFIWSVFFFLNITSLVEFGIFFNMLHYALFVHLSSSSLGCDTISREPCYAISNSAGSNGIIWY